MTTLLDSLIGHDLPGDCPSCDGHSRLTKDQGRYTLQISHAEECPRAEWIAGAVTDVLAGLVLSGATFRASAGGSALAGLSCAGCPVRDAVPGSGCTPAEDDAGTPRVSGGLETVGPFQASSALANQGAANGLLHDQGPR